VYTPSSLSEVGALAELETVTGTIKRLDDEAYDARVRRDELVLTLLEKGAPYRQLQRITGLSRAALIKIQDSPRRPK
jgi:hypothetical protein